MRQLIAAAVNAEPRDRPVGIESALTKSIVGESRSRIEIRLTVAERNAVALRAAAWGLNSNRWIVALVRTQLTREPQLGGRELLLLSVSNQQLAVIGRLLGQLARGGGAALTCQKLADFGGIREQIDTHLRAVTGVIRANLDRWGP
ncbi:plasmid stabilization protein [Paraburkholderia caffeinilytica]|uniref:plasmid stabilization protein n=1 Tax=Paraburkholderia caffeinilytica TaxID=1761016 RepID=UPI003DA102CC